MNYLDLLGMIAGALTTFAYIPQVIKTWKTGSAHDISFLMLLTMATGVFLWSMYGIYINSFPVIIANSVTLVLVSGMIIMKAAYNRIHRQGPES